MTTPKATYGQTTKELRALKINMVENIRTAGIIIFDDSLIIYHLLHPEQAKAVDFFLHEKRYIGEVVEAVNEWVMIFLPKIYTPSHFSL